MASLFTHWFSPHYTNNHRPKLLQPIGLSLMVAVFLLVQSTLQLMELSPTLPGGFVLGYASNISPEQVIDLTNAERAKIGLGPLSMNGQLNQAALAKANDMFLNDYWAHVSPAGLTPWVFIKNSGYSYTVAGENLARDFGDTGSMMQAWMNSETHKANIVHTKYSQIGVAVVNGKLQGVETTLVVQMFGNPSVATARATDEAATTETKPAVTEVAKLEEIPLDLAPLEIVEVEPVEIMQTPLPVMTESTLGSRMTNYEPTIVVSPLTVTKVVGTSLISILVLVLTYDSLMISKKKLPRKVGNNWAHIGLFGVVILIIIAMTQGKVI